MGNDTIENVVKDKNNTIKSFIFRATFFCARIPNLSSSSVELCENIKLIDKYAVINSIIV